MEALCGCEAEWRDILIGKLSISIVMVGCRAVVGYAESISVVYVGIEFRPRCVYWM